MNSLLELTAGHNCVSIVGMSKNSGKTTVLNRLILECGQAGLRVALCSVGRDGERTDVITGKLKPAIAVSKGTIFATTRNLLAYFDIGKELLLSTGVGTALGEVVVYRALDDGLIELSGPSMNSQLPPLLEFFISQGAGMILIDGAVSRKASSSPVVAGCTVLCTGADYDPDMSIVITDTAHIAEILKSRALPDSRAAGLIVSHKGPGKLHIDKDPLFLHTDKDPGILLIDKDYNATVFPKSGGISKQDIMAARCLYFPGALTDAVCETVFKAAFPTHGISIVTDNASKLMVSRQVYSRFLSRGAGFYVLDPILPACICINPHSTMGKDFDKDSFLADMQKAVDIPVINVAQAT